MLNPDVRASSTAPSLGHLATVLPDGSPHSTPVFVGNPRRPVDLLHRSALAQSPPTCAATHGSRWSLAPADNPFQPVIIRGRVTEWLEGDTAWEIIDQIATKYTGQPYTRHQERIVAVVEPDQQDHRYRLNG